MEERTMWFFAALAILAVLSSSAPRVAGGLVVLIVLFLAIRIAKETHYLDTRQ